MAKSTKPRSVFPRILDVYAAYEKAGHEPRHDRPDLKAHPAQGQQRDHPNARFRVDQAPAAARAQGEVRCSGSRNENGRQVTAGPDLTGALLFLFASVPQRHFRRSSIMI